MEISQLTNISTCYIFINVDKEVTTDSPAKLSRIGTNNTLNINIRTNLGVNNSKIFE